MARSCAIEGCERAAAARGLCRGHYGRWAHKQLHPDWEPPATPPGHPGFCTIDGCERERAARGLCGRHYARRRRQAAEAEAEPYRAPSPVPVLDVRL